MKKFFEYTGILVLISFSFIYTEKAVELVNKNDPIMVSINNYADQNDKKCIEGEVTSDGVILGLSGLIVNKEESYRNMKGWGYSDDLIEYKKDNCLINSSAYLDEYIVKGNNSQKKISFIILLNGGEYLDYFEKIAKEQKITFNYGTDNYLNSGYNYVFIGKDEDELKKYIKFLNKDDYKICLEIGDNEILGICSDNKINTIRAKNIFYKDLFINIKNNLNNGEIFIFNENEELKAEINVILNYVKAKGYDVVKIKELLEG